MNPRYLKVGTSCKTSAFMKTLTRLALLPKTIDLDLLVLIVSLFTVNHSQKSFRLD